LFATHYFELTELAAQFDAIANVHLDAVEYHDARQGDQLVFMHAVKEGPANRSFGLQVAALAGLPKAVIADAKQTLAELEQGARGSRSTKAAAKGADSPQSDLFAAPRPDPRLAQLAEAVRALDPDAMTPKEALDALYRLKQSGQ
jgi:DNA mismatch repair protein MutS